jgi:hypothetical protein
MPSRREELEAELAKLAKDEEDARNRFEVEIGQDGAYARVPYEKGKSWLQKTFGIDLDEEPKQDAEPDKKDEDKPVRFGRRVS